MAQFGQVTVDVDGTRVVIRLFDWPAYHDEAVVPADDLDDLIRGLTDARSKLRGPMKHSEWMGVEGRLFRERVRAIGGEMARTYTPFGWWLDGYQAALAQEGAQ